jgi:type 1 glutamine amidotransferase
MKILVFCDDRWHPASTINQGLEAFQKVEGYWMENHSPPTFHFDWIENAHDWSADRMGEYDVVILTKSNNVSAQDELHWMTDEVAASFVDYVCSGKGLLVVHSGSAGYAEVPALRRLMGGVFVQHPPQCLVNIHLSPDHPLTINRATGNPGLYGQSIPDFQVIDEHYFMTMEEKEAVEVFMTTTSEHGTQPGGWRREEGKGRVCMLTPGHNLEVWLQPGFKSLLYNAICWCGGVG